jgi:hypothetical protein
MSDLQKKRVIRKIRTIAEQEERKRRHALMLQQWREYHDRYKLDAPIASEKHVISDPVIDVDFSD